MTSKILNPKEIRTEILNAEWHPIDEWTIERSAFLGTVFSLYPSGKYYTPFACSNIEPCTRCKGDGSIGKEECPTCHGVGSEEAYKDEQFREQLELEASEMGLYVREGEGDPCDIFIAQGMDVLAECEHCSSTHTEWLQGTEIECYDCGKITEFYKDTLLEMEHARNT